MRHMSMEEEWGSLMAPWRQMARASNPAKRASLITRAWEDLAEEEPLAEPIAGRWVIAGDTHGDAHYVTALIDEVVAAGLDRLIILGAVAGTRADQVEGFLDWVSHAFLQNDVTLLWLDGNHDAHRDGVLDRCPVDPRTGTRPVRPRVHHLPRGLRWQWGDVRQCGAGGAVSVDRRQRTECVTVFTPEEELTDQGIDQIGLGGDCDVLLTYDRPAWVEGALRETPGAWWIITPGIWADSDFYRAQEHQARLDRLVTNLISSTTPWGGPCHVTGLANEGQKYLNRVVVSTRPDLADLDTVTIEELR